MWRPFRGLVEQWPLAICDASNTTLDDMEELEYVTEEFVRSSYLGKWSDKLQFWYLSRMTSDEVAVFKIFDSAYHAPQGDSPGASTRRFTRETVECARANDNYVSRLSSCSIRNTGRRFGATSRKRRGANVCDIRILMSTCRWTFR